MNQKTDKQAHIKKKFHIHQERNETIEEVGKGTIKQRDTNIPFQIHTNKHKQKTIKQFYKQQTNKQKRKQTITQTNH